MVENFKISVSTDGESCEIGAPEKGTFYDRKELSVDHKHFAIGEVSFRTRGVIVEHKGKKRFTVIFPKHDLFFDIFLNFGEIEKVEVYNASKKEFLFHTQVDNDVHVIERRFEN